MYSRSTFPEGGQRISQTYHIEPFGQLSKPSNARAVTLVDLLGPEAARCAIVMSTIPLLHGHIAHLTDAGVPGIILLDLVAS